MVAYKKSEGLKEAESSEKACGGEADLHKPGASRPGPEREVVVSNDPIESKQGSERYQSTDPAGLRGANYYC